MPVIPTYPGVYIEEVPSGVRTITGVATSIAAFVGFTARGPVNRAVRIFNFGDFERSFGGLSRDGDVGYAVQQFFQNGGTDAYVVRVAAGAASAVATLRFAAGGGNDALIVSAADPGAWGNLVRLEVDYATTNPDSTFNLTVVRYELQGGALVPVETEQHRNLGMNSRSASYAPNVVNAASRLVRLTRPPGIAFADRGFALSGELDPFPAVALDQTTISGIIDGFEPFTLVLPSPPPSSMTTLLNRMTTAITNAGLGTRLQANRADETGANAAGGNHIKLTSLEDAANPSTSEEHASVEIVPSATNDASAPLRLGLAAGGREVDGSSRRRPLQTGTTSGDLSTQLGTSITGNVDVTIEDQSSGAPVSIISQTVALPGGGVEVGPALRDELQTLIRGIPDPAAANAVVELAGTRLRVVTSAETPNATIAFAGAGAVAARLTPANDAFSNVQEYALGAGAEFGAQTATNLGADGSPPFAAQLLGSFANKEGIYALRDVDLFNILCIPRTAALGDADAGAVIAAATAFCQERRAFYIVDPSPARTRDDIDEFAAGITSRNAAVYFPRIRAADPLDGFRLRDMPASGAIAGVYARIDAERGIWKAPAGTEASLRGVQGLSYTLTDQENGTLNPRGVNSLRSFAVFGNVVWGARTLDGDDQRASEWKYIPVRRLALFLEESLYRGTTWAVFEPNDEPLWAQLRLNIGAFMQNLFRQGAFQGRSAREAYFVKVDSETTTQNDVNLGVVNIVVGFAPLKPAEFVIVKIQQLAGQVQA